MDNKQDYLARLRSAIQQSHNCQAVYRETVRVHAACGEKTLFDGDVEVFDLSGHSKARCCYGWSRRKSPDEPEERLVTRLQLPPVGDAPSAVAAVLEDEVDAAIEQTLAAIDKTTDDFLGS